MNRKLARVIFFAILILSVATSSSAQSTAVKAGEDWFRLEPSGPINVKTPGTLVLDVRITGKSRISASGALVAELVAIVIDPFNGTRVAGPLSAPVNQRVMPDQPISATINIPIGSLPNKTLAAVITAIGANNVARGTVGWAFVTL